MSTKDELKREADSASKKLSEASEEVKARARDAAEEAQRAATSYAEQGKQQAAGHLADFASAIRSASKDLSEHDKGFAARFVTEAADGLEKVANSISGTSVDEMMSSVQGFARRNPGAFVIGTVLAGVALGRFAKASSERQHYDDNYGYGYDRPVGSPGGTHAHVGAASSGPTTTRSQGAAGGNVKPATGPGSSTNINTAS